MPTPKSYRGIPAWKIAWFLRQNMLFFISAVLLAFSTYFYIQAEAYRHSIKHTDAEAFQTGDLVVIETVIDGDEIQVTNSEGQQAVVRLLGIRSFDPVVNDPVLAQVGQACFSYLQSNALGQKAELTINSELKVDDEGRLLAYLSLINDDGSERKDLGLDLIEQGLTLVYERYAFEREQAYLKAEQHAQAEQRGLWAKQNVVDRAEALKRDWREEKRREAAE